MPGRAARLLGKREPDVNFWHYEKCVKSGGEMKIRKNELAPNLTSIQMCSSNSAGTLIFVSTLHRPFIDRSKGLLSFLVTKFYDSFGRANAGDDANTKRTVSD
jgi:hypothetical protein